MKTSLLLFVILMTISGCTSCPWKCRCTDCPIEHYPGPIYSNSIVTWEIGSLQIYSPGPILFKDRILLERTWHICTYNEPGYPVQEYVR